MPTDFIDYYELMQISPSAELPTIERVYRILAARYHPDNPETGDPEKFVLLQRAYEVLTDPGKRESFDKDLHKQWQQPLPVFEMKEFVVGIDAEQNRRLGVLCLLYNRRRTTPDHPSIALLELETKMNLPREHLEFTIWYLREKGHVRRDETTSEFILTAEGVDFLEKSMPTNKVVHKLLKAAETGRGWAPITPNTTTE